MANRTWLVAVAIVAVLAGCGGGGGNGDSDQAKISEAIKTYTAAIADKNGPSGCGVLTDKAREDVALMALLSERKTCEKGVAELGGLRAGEGTQKDLNFATVSDIEISGSSARAQVSSSDPFISTSADLVKVGDEWKISKPPGIGR